jgi:hypothetical protein
MRSAVGQFTATACHFLDWDNGGAGSPAIQVDAGRAIVQACTFNQAKLQVLVATNVTSAILCANQAEGGFRVRNRAGKRTQLALNEEDPLNWTAEARAHYRITLGARGDARYLETWQGPEKADRPFRWSGAVSRLALPVLPGRTYTLTLDLRAPAPALSPDAGLYRDGKLLAPLKSQSALKATLAPASGDSLELELRCKGWVPGQVLAGSGDPRVLGVQVFGLVMEAEGAAAEVFDANTGQTPGPP